MDTRISKLMLVLGPGAGKSRLTSITYPAFLTGQDPTMTILGISAGESLMTGFQNSVADWIEHSPIWNEIFPDVRPDKNKGWSTERGIFVTGHLPGDPDANYFACGLSSSALTGKHAKLLNCDDLHNKENSQSTDACQRVHGDYYKTILGRQDPQGCKIVLTGRRWNMDDLYGHLKDLGEYVVMELPAIREDTDALYWDVAVPTDSFGKPLHCCFTDGSMSNINLID